MTVGNISIKRIECLANIDKTWKQLTTMAQIIINSKRNNTCVENIQWPV